MAKSNREPFAVVFDTETTTLPKDELPANDPNQAYPIQLAWTTVDDDYDIIEEKSIIIIPPEGVIMHPRAQQAHGKSIEYCLRHGIPFEDALAQFRADCDACMVRAAYNIQFDDKIMANAFERHNPDVVLATEDRKKNDVRIAGAFGPTFPVCVMQLATAHMRVPRDAGGYRNLTLSQVYRRLTGRKMQNAHDAMGDVRATLIIWRELLSLTPFPIDPPTA